MIPDVVQRQIRDTLLERLKVYRSGARNAAIFVGLMLTALLGDALAELPASTLIIPIVGASVGTSFWLQWRAKERYVRDRLRSDAMETEIS